MASDNCLLEKLKSNSVSGRLPMHMPGHKRNSDAFPYLSDIGGRLDITETDGFDDLNSPSGIFAESEKIASEVWGSRATIYSVNGSTGAILASVRAALTVMGDGAHVLASRASHRSVYHALELCAATTIFITPKTDDSGALLSVSPADVERAIEADPEIRLVIITSPTYEGVISDIKSISEICKKHRALLMVDEAHGAHLGLSDIFPAGAVQCGADIVVQSVHKMLPALTQCAMIHVGCGFESHIPTLRRQMQIFQTSSPSYILSSSIDCAVRTIRDRGNELLAEWHKNLMYVHERLEAMHTLRILSDKTDGIFASDPAHITVCCENSSVSGMELCDILRREGIEPEMGSVGYALALSGIGDNRKSLEYLTEALIKIDDELVMTDKPKSYASDIRIPKKALDVNLAVRSPSEEVPIGTSIGRISAEYIYAYPPGIPLAVPGEVIDERLISTLISLIDAGCSIRGLSERGHVRVLSEKFAQTPQK